MDQTMEKAQNFLGRVDEGPGARNEVDRRVVSLTAPASVGAEQYRTLFYRLERMRALRPMKVVAFTSAMPGEGKTVTTVNLALTAARAAPERRILLIDTDLRRSQVANVLGFKNTPGLSELLQGECQLAEAVRRFRSTRLAIVPAGAAPEEPTQLLASRRMKDFLQAVRDNFDEVYLDLPPSLPFADASILAAQSDGTVMVIRANVTRTRQVQQAIEHLAGAAIVGCVLNGGPLATGGYLKAYK
ncbi:MAG: CpsD/CapB family tyrosine-protein kinase [Myxococcaceae bacterium]|nr:CpsD/CapB family tyrosine-protein kinase [Myxococcaceae bacterium]